MIAFTDIGTMDALTTLSVFILCLMFSSLSIQGLTDSTWMGKVRTTICAALALTCWTGFGGIFTIDQQYGSYLVLGYVWYGFAFIFLVFTVAMSASLWQFRQRENEFTVR